MGSVALNISISERLCISIVNDAQENVGLLQRLAERLCLAAGIVANQRVANDVDDDALYAKSRQEIASAERRRYEQFAIAFIRGFKGYETSQLRAYEKVAKVCLEAPDHELIAGIEQDIVLSRVRDIADGVRSSDLTSALKNLDRLQVQRKIRPLVLSYNETIRRVFLVDRELLFFRRYGTPRWPWDMPLEEQQNLLALIPDTSDQ